MKDWIEFRFAFQNQFGTKHYTVKVCKITSVAYWMFCRLKPNQNQSYSWSCFNYFVLIYCTEEGNEISITTTTKLHLGNALHKNHKWLYKRRNNIQEKNDQNNIILYTRHANMIKTTCRPDVKRTSCRARRSVQRKTKAKLKHRSEENTRESRLTLDLLQRKTQHI